MKLYQKIKEMMSIEFKNREKIEGGKCNFPFFEYSSLQSKDYYYNQFFFKKILNEHSKMTQ